LIPTLFKIVANALVIFCARWSKLRHNPPKIKLQGFLPSANKPATDWDLHGPGSFFTMLRNILLLVVLSIELKGIYRCHQKATINTISPQRDPPQHFPCIFAFLSEGSIL
jgi:hypothetical protein